ncbi:hypothetical protein NDU88_000812 [Pleurodeles waltl]|uniref:Secreted protein n=1 Tax=Pleurodeles waltl TaxID=8319 RepID=A0AAV7USE5_PLEWA|nr:hypothetical protein NDU88_000812 [Pleurodeles waltl]
MIPALFCPLPVIVLAHFVLLGTSSVGDGVEKTAPAIRADPGRSAAVRALVFSTDLYCISVTLLALRRVTQTPRLSPPALALRSPGPARHQAQSHLHRGLRTAQHPTGEGGRGTQAKRIGSGHTVTAQAPASSAEQNCVAATLTHRCTPPIRFPFSGCSGVSPGRDRSFHHGWPQFSSDLWSLAGPEWELRNQTTAILGG